MRLNHFKTIFLKKLKRITKKSKVSVMYTLHSPFPVIFLKREGSPDKIYVHGNDQKYHCIRYLRWKKNQVKSIPSFRFLKKNKSFFFK